MALKITIPGRFPSLNDYISAERANSRYAAKIKREETRRVADAALGIGSVQSPVTVYFNWVEPNARRDIDNVAFAKKFILDGLVKAGVLAGDSRKHVIGFSDSFSEIDPINPRVEITIMEV